MLHSPVTGAKIKTPAGSFFQTVQPVYNHTTNLLTPVICDIELSVVFARSKINFENHLLRQNWQQVLKLIWKKK